MGQDLNILKILCHILHQCNFSVRIFEADQKLPTSFLHFPLCLCDFLLGDSGLAGMTEVSFDQLRTNGFYLNKACYSDPKRLY